MFQTLFEQQAAQQAAGQVDDVFFIKTVFDHIRPRSSDNIEEAGKAIQALCFLLQQSPAFKIALRFSLLRMLEEKSVISLYSDHGIQSDLGFFTEIYRRISRKLLPDVPDPKYLKDVFGQIFYRIDDCTWVTGVPDSVWRDFMHTLALHEADATMQANCIQELKDALQILSYRLSASGLDPELLLQHEDLENNDSPFVTQNIEIQQFLGLANPSADDIQHLYDALKRCEQLTQQIRKANAKNRHQHLTNGADATHAATD